MTDQSAISQLWNDRSSLEEQAGTQDLIAKQLEVEAIASYVKDGMRVLDAGCGNGVTALELARRFDVEITAIDSSEKMVCAAIDRWHTMAAGLRRRVMFYTGDVLNLNWLRIDTRFDLIYTERTLINIPKQEDREKAVVGLCNLLKPGGLYVMCENSQDGLDRLNKMRAGVDLPEIVPPWHNHYLTDKDIGGFMDPAYDHFLDGTDDYSSTYYFLSRVVNAALAAQAGEEPKYDSEINRLALRLPPIGDVGQGMIWLWRRKLRDEVANDG